MMKLKVLPMLRRRSGAQESRWREVLAKRDTAAIASFYAEDGVYAPDNAQAAYHGRDSVSARWAREVQTPEFQLERTSSRIDVASSAICRRKSGGRTLCGWFATASRTRATETT